MRCTAKTCRPPAVIAGIGRVEGVECMIVANDATVKGGSYYPLTVKKHLRAQDHRPARTACRASTWWTPAAPNLPRQDEVFPDREHFGRIFFNQANMSAQGIPQIAVVMGSCTAGGAYVPAMSRRDHHGARTRPPSSWPARPLVKAATGEVVSAEDLGGADVHCKTQRRGRPLAEDDEHALAHRPALHRQPQPAQARPAGSARTASPRCTARGAVRGDPRRRQRPFDVREVIARVVDGSELDEFKAATAPPWSAGFAHLHGYPVAILANNGILFAESAQKGAHFVELACQRGIPLLFLQNITGFMVGKKYEEGGIAKHGAKLVTAVACARCRSSP